jgi:hypothetical protein
VIDIVIAEHYTVKAISAKVFAWTIFCSQTVFSKYDQVSTWNRFLAYQLLPQGYKKSPEFSVNRKYIPVIRIHNHWSVL